MWQKQKKRRGCPLYRKRPELYRKGFPNQNSLLKTLNENFAKFDTLKIELYILGDFNKNFYQNQNHTGYKNNTLVLMTVSNDVKNYLRFCTMFGLTQIIKSPTCIICSSTSLIDHILASLPESRGGSRAAATFKTERVVIVVNGFSR